MLVPSIGATIFGGGRHQRSYAMSRKATTLSGEPVFEKERRLFSRLDKVILLSDLNARILVQFPVLHDHGEVRLMLD